MKLRKMSCFFLVVALLFTMFTFPVHAEEILESNPEQEVLLSIRASEAPDFILSELNRDSVIYNDQSLINVIKNNLNDSSFIAVTTNEGTVCRTNTVVSVSEEANGTIVQDNFAENLLLAPMDSAVDNNTWNGTKITSECVYSRWTISGNSYAKPLSENFICTNTGNGKRPTKVSLILQLGGSLYNMTSNPPAKVQSDYFYSNSSHSVNNPAFSSRYNYTISNFPSSRAVLPENWNGGFHLITKATINGQNYEFDYNIAL